MGHLFLFIASAVLILSWEQNATTKKESKNDFLEMKSTVLTGVTNTISKADTIIQLIITPQKKEGGLGQTTFSQNGKTLFYFVSKSKRGKIIINGAEYILKKLSFNKGSYKILGDKVIISASNCNYNTNQGGDCRYGKSCAITITLNSSSVTIKNVEVQDCPDVESLGESNDATSLINTKLLSLEAQYTKRIGLYSKVLETAEASTNFDKATLQTVIEGEHKATSANVDINNPETVKSFQHAQNSLQESFGRLMAMFEQFPDLKKTRGFQDYQSQIEGTENRINVIILEYNDLCQENGRTDILFGK